jgi:ABC-2 type transport system permease protein
MNRLWTVASHEFLSNVRKRSFLLSLFGFPLMMIAIITIVGLVTSAALNSGEVRLEAVGYVDSIDLADASKLPEGWRRYDSTALADEALQAAEIDAYLVLERPFMMTGTLKIVARGTLPDDVEDAVEEFVLGSLATRTNSNLPENLLEQPADMDVLLLNTGRTIDEATIFVLLMVPLVFMVLFMMGLQIGSAYLMGSIVEEKTNRIMEVLITSITPYQLLAGKVLGLGAVALLQLVVWVAVGIVLYIISNSAIIQTELFLPWDIIALAMVYFVFTYFLYGGLLAGVGVIVDGEQESRQYGGIVSFLVVIPLFAISSFFEDANGTVPVILSYFPFTSGMAMIMRSVLGTVTVGEIVLSLGILLVTTVVVSWGVAKVFRWGILLYGKKASARDLWRVLRGRPEIGGVA